MGYNGGPRRLDFVKWLGENYPNQWVKVPDINTGNFPSVKTSLEAKGYDKEIVVVHRNTRRVKGPKSTSIGDAYIMVVA